MYLTKYSIFYIFVDFDEYDDYDNYDDYEDDYDYDNDYDEPNDNCSFFYLNSFIIFFFIFFIDYQNQPAPKKKSQSKNNAPKQKAVFAKPKANKNKNVPKQTSTTQQVSNSQKPKSTSNVPQQKLSPQPVPKKTTPKISQSTLSSSNDSIVNSGTKPLLKDDPPPEPYVGKVPISVAVIGHVDAGKSLFFFFKNNHFLYQKY